MASSEISYASIILVLGCLACICCTSKKVKSKQYVSHQPSDSTTIVLLNTDSILSAISSSPELKIIRNAGVGGTVLILIHVYGNGRYSDHEVLQSPHPLSTDAVVNLIPQMRFGINKGSDFSTDQIYGFPFKFRYTTY